LAATAPLNPREGGLIARQVDCQVDRGLRDVGGTSNGCHIIVVGRRPVGSGNC
jgi:hypothetical protein